jgi:hypothetical protein
MTRKPKVDMVIGQALKTAKASPHFTAMHSLQTLTHSLLIFASILSQIFFISGLSVAFRLSPDHLGSFNSFHPKRSPRLVDVHRGKLKSHHAPMWVFRSAINVVFAEAVLKVVQPYDRSPKLRELRLRI